MCFMVVKKKELFMLEFKKESYAIRGAIFEVYKEMGCGFLESVYSRMFRERINAEKHSLCLSSRVEASL